MLHEAGHEPMDSQPGIKEERKAVEWGDGNEGQGRNQRGRKTEAGRKRSAASNLKTQVCLHLPLVYILGVYFHMHGLHSRMPIIPSLQGALTTHQCTHKHISVTPFTSLSPHGPSRNHPSYQTTTHPQATTPNPSSWLPHRHHKPHTKTATVPSPLSRPSTAFHTRLHTDIANTLIYLAMHEPGLLAKPPSSQPNPLHASRFHEPLTMHQNQPHMHTQHDSTAPKQPPSRNRDKHHRHPCPCPSKQSTSLDFPLLTPCIPVTEPSHPRSTHEPSPAASVAAQLARSFPSGSRFQPLHASFTVSGPLPHVVTAATHNEHTCTRK